MKILWYWPFVREEEISMARATLRDGDSILIQAVDRAQAPKVGCNDAIDMLLDLPNINRDARSTWLFSRAHTYTKRALARNRQIDRGKFDVVHIHYLNRFTDAIWRLPRSSILTVHDAVAHVPRMGRRGEAALLRRIYHRPAAIVVHHQFVADELVDRFSVSADRIHVIPYPVLERHNASQQVGKGAPIGTLTVLMFGALRPNKGLEILAEAARLMQDVEVRFVVAGQGHRDLEDYGRNLQRLDHRFSVEIGYISPERKAELFLHSSIVVLPYTSFSSQSGVLHDAYRYGRPVVVSDVGALGPTVTDDGTGLVVQPRNAEALADALIQLRDPALWAKFSEASRLVARLRTPEHFGRTLRDLYENLSVPKNIR